MSRYSLMVLATIGATIVFIAAAVIVRGVVWSLVRLLWPGGASVVPNRAGKRSKLR